MKLNAIPFLIPLLLCTGCGDVDVSETVTDEYTYARDGSFTSDTSCAVLGMDTVSASRMHAPGQRNASTMWFFHQPWAARAYWGKLVRDSFFFLFVASLVTFFSRRKDDHETEE